MVVFMIHKKEKYEKGEFTQFQTKIIFDKNLSATARAVLIYMLSNIKTWNYTEQCICEGFGIKITELRTALKQLEQFGYLKRTRYYENGKFKKYLYDIYENPDDNEEFNNQPFGII